MLSAISPEWISLNEFFSVAADGVCDRLLRTLILDVFKLGEAVLQSLSKRSNSTTTPRAKILFVNRRRPVAVDRFLRR